MQTTDRVKGALDADPEATALVDVIGIGAGVLDRLREMGAKAQPFTASAGTRRRDATNELGFTNWLTGDARLAPIGQLLPIYRSRYEGSLIQIKMASGDHFTATPNHQVLTSHGWITVQSLCVGDELADSTIREAADVSAVGPEIDRVPPKVSELYGAADRLFGAERVKPGAVNFHGDRPVSEVDVVTIDRDLLAVYPALGQRGQDAQLLRALLGEGSLPGESVFPQPLGIGGRDAWVAPAFSPRR